MPVRKSLCEDTCKSPKTRSSSCARVRPCTSPKKSKACCSSCEVKCDPRKCIDLCRPYVDLCRPCPPVYRPCPPVCRPYPELCRPCYPVAPRHCSPALCADKERELVKGLYDTIREERDLESAKLNLARRADFNFYDAFKIFDTCSRGYFTLADLREGLAAIGVYPTSSDMELYIKRYDKFNERKVRFADFCESFTPTTDSYYSSTLNRRRSNFFASNRFGARDDCFEAGTRVEFRAAFNTHFKVEAKCEGIRQGLRSLPCFDLYSAFLTCDFYNDGFIS